jgi:hypothetical protein
LKDFLRLRLENSKKRLDRITHALEAERAERIIDDAEWALCRKRLASLADLQNKILALAPLAEKAL